ncbi:glycosyltransferase [Roseovarius sp. M141]|uniref:glycosyltransferase n=1 Tax=Roseovarius sp. M141 TaxID=2583806 RepID=UPI0020CCBDAB|nr:glycosyltransferase [Roseovarius sp. M141]MCQ0090547.1 glycosyltransferase [Roseovarius sp. M141]
MALPLPLIEPATASRTLVSLWRALHHTNPGPAGRPPTLLLTLPTAWANRYQVLLYGQAARHGVAVAGLRLPKDLAHVSWPGPVVLHAHWFAAIFYGALSEADAMARLTRTIDMIETFRARTGARLLWTAHNVFPHGNAYPQTYLALRRWIFDSFDAVHVMDDAHLPLLEQAFDRAAPPAFTVPHMTYDGTVPDSVDAIAARAHFSIPRDAFVFGSFGSLQGYKNIGPFLQRFTALANARPERTMAALVGGLPSDRDIARDLVHRFGTDPRITLLARKVEDTEIQYLHRAADVMVLPYRETLNSGAAMMAATFAKPFVMPATPGAEALIPIGAQLFDRNAADGLGQALENCLSHPATPPDPAALAALAPPRISAMFFRALDEVLARPYSRTSITSL